MTSVTLNAASSNPYQPEINDDLGALEAISQNIGHRNMTAAQAQAIYTQLQDLLNKTNGDQTLLQSVKDLISGQVTAFYNQLGFDPTTPNPNFQDMANKLNSQGSYFIENHLEQVNDILTTLDPSSQNQGAIQEMVSLEYGMQDGAPNVTADQAAAFMATMNALMNESDLPADVKNEITTVMNELGVDPGTTDYAHVASQINFTFGSVDPYVQQIAENIGTAFERAIEAIRLAP